MDVNRRTIIGATAALAVAPGISTSASSRLEAKFPKGFLWGAATSGHQVEGNNLNSDVWVVEHVEPTMFTEPSGDANNSFELWPQDLDIVKALGLNTYRFSLEWSRIEPEPGMFSIAMLDHYEAMIEGCRDRGIVPIVTFNHFAVPRWFAARGAWTAADAPDLFARFCERAARQLAGEISYAITLNEPNLVNVLRSGSVVDLSKVLPLIRAMKDAAAKSVGSTQFVNGYSLGVDDVDAVTRNLIAAHEAGRGAIKAIRSDLPVGVSLAIIDEQSAGPNSLRDAMREKQYGAWLNAVRGDDFLGVQNYEHNVWDDKGKVEVPATGDVNASGAPVHPPSLAGAVRYAHSVAGIPIIVTEHGVNTEDDSVRARLVPAALAELKKAMDDGVPVHGYVHWSLLDNFEWFYGYGPKYGLVSVDRRTFERTPKPSSAVFASIARNNAIVNL